MIAELTGVPGSQADHLYKVANKSPISFNRRAPSVPTATDRSNFKDRRATQLRTQNATGNIFDSYKYGAAVGKRGTGFYDTHNTSILSTDPMNTTLLKNTFKKTQFHKNDSRAQSKQR